MRPRRVVRAVLGGAGALALAGSPGCLSVRNPFDPCGRIGFDPPGGQVLNLHFAPEGGGFRVGLPPAEPVESGAAGGAKGKTYRWSVLGHGQYEITYAETPWLVQEPGAGALLFDRMKASALAQGNRRLESERELRLGPHAGRELVLRDDKGVLVLRFYLAGARVYVVGGSVSSGLERCELGGIIKRLDTFEIVEEGAPAAPTPGAE